MLSKTMVKALIAVINGLDHLEALQKELKASKSWVARIISSLEKHGFIRKIRKGKDLKIELATTPYAIAFKDMYIGKTYKKYEKIFSGRNLDVLLAIVTGEKSTKTISDMLDVQPRVIRPRIRFLANNGLIKKRECRYSIAKNQKEVISFLKSLRNFSEKNGIVLWKFGKNALIRKNRPSETDGLLTGFNRYADYGVQVNTIAYLY
jgi:DNA-binding HxlR family transcriptional regulator